MFIIYKILYYLLDVEMFFYFRKLEKILKIKKIVILKKMFVLFFVFYVISII